jgi:glycosyltransferase involved in cell wall biosynthesis
MTAKPFFSVVIPCYNAARFIAATLQAVRDQSFPDWEAIVLDDGSTDASAALVEAIAAADSRIRLVRRPNSGVSKTRNAGAAAASGHYLAFLDADDLWHPAYLERMAAHLRARPGVGIAFAVARIVDGQGTPTGAFSSQKSSGLDTFDFLSSNPTTTCSNLIVERTAFDRLGGFPEEIGHAEDQLFLIRAHLDGVPVEGVPEALVDYRINENGLSADLDSMRRGWEFLAAQVVREAPEIIGPLIPRARALILSYLARRALRVRSSQSAWGYMRGALRSDWTILIAKPWPTVPLALACLLALPFRSQVASMPEKAL